MIRPRIRLRPATGAIIFGAVIKTSASPGLRTGLLHSVGRKYRFYSDAATAPSSPSPLKRSLFRRALGFSAIAIFSFILGSSANPQLKNMGSVIVEPATDEETLTKFVPEDDVTREINDFINTHPLAVSLRGRPEFTESRPHLKIPAKMRSHNLTSGTLAGPDKIVVPPYVWIEDGGKSLVSMLYLGTDLSGHPGIVHGGLLATLLDETLARCCFPALPNKVGVTANLNVDYRKPAVAGNYFVIRAETTKVEGRKAWVTGRIETLPEEGKEPTVLVEAKALFVEPKNAGMLPALYKVA